MKKISTMLAVSVLSCSTVFGQRIVDLAATLTTPAAGSTITSGQSFAVNASVKNVGTTPLLATDTVIIGFRFEGQELLKDASGNLIARVILGPIAVNESKSITPFNLTITHSENTGTKFCAVALPVNRSADSVKDGNLDNNEGCNSVQLVSGGTSIHDMTASQSKHLVSNAYPNPAKGAVNFDLKMGERDVVSITLTDMTGRTVLTESKGSLPAGDHILNVGTGYLPSGIYLYEVNIGGERNRGKLSVSNK